MIKKTALSVLIILSGFFSCVKKEKYDPNHNAYVIAKGAYCGDSYLIQFYKNVENLPNNFQDYTYQEINLPDSLKVPGKDIMVQFRTPTSEERISCEVSNINYPQIFIISATD